uniref:Uncharacterized protein n=1 Tax=Magnetospirillum gryphiswaldense TaxID=55518 RepID=A4TZ23_9PROT|nr:hypothetical protein MGR_1537 [Magnetospirillum gryphiswaldense MSR-1]
MAQEVEAVQAMRGVGLLTPQPANSAINDKSCSTPLTPATPTASSSPHRTPGPGHANGSLGEPTRKLPKAPA